MNPEPAETPPPPPTASQAPAQVPVRQARRGESQKDIERGIIRWMLVFFFGTHLVGGAIWLAIYLTGHGGT